ncbi:hypothetical protein EA462_14205 [Natrarchaeobius halalkaliphilus]|uniref:Phage late control D family protein n=1 Tax=Natrarchaeobius halalkaliphilus TaxID=1679091 RepID=A0A3N6LJ01_9EURY|nr:contractile injection system protein, VgrG/Pvc8 family [Natrarchaeobius halalkaliphilus]RQG88006.1 hypothetical protein EA462_14205 [Natrarchaeobius halalkaliphilus]
MYPGAKAAQFVVKIGTETFREYSESVSEVTVDTAVDGADRCRIALTPPFDHEFGSFKNVALDSIGPGTGVSVGMAYGEESSAQLFSGEVETVEPTFPTAEPPWIVVTAYGHSRKMMRGTRSDSWKGKSLEAIVESIASNYFEDIEIEDGGITPQGVIQDNESDYRFLKRVAAKYGFEFFSSAGTLYFVPRDGGVSPGDPVTTLTYGSSLESFSATTKALRHGAVVVKYWDRERRKKISAEANNGSGGSPEVFRIRVSSQAEAQRIADSKLHTSRVTGVAKTFGIPSLVAGEVVELTGFSSEYEKNYYITDAIHRIGDDGYKTEFEVRGL